jgi:hypothetical protein
MVTTYYAAELTSERLLAEVSGPLESFAEANHWHALRMAAAPPRGVTEGRQYLVPRPPPVILLDLASLQFVGGEDLQRVLMDDPALRAVYNLGRADARRQL